MKWPIIIKYTPLEEIKAIHQRILDYAIEHGKKPNTRYRSDCVVCEYRYIQNDDFMCMRCLISWPNNLTCVEYHSIYRQWSREKDPEKKADLARQIRDLPFKYELEEK